MPGVGTNRSQVLQEIVRRDERKEKHKSVLQEKAALQNRIDKWEGKRAGQNKREFVSAVTGVRVTIFQFSHYQANDILKGRDYYVGTLRRRIHVDERYEDEKNKVRQERLDDPDRLYYRRAERRSSNIKQVIAPENLAESLVVDNKGCFLGRTNIHLAGHRIQIPCDGLYTNIDYLLRGTHVFARLPKLDAYAAKKNTERKMSVHPVYLNTEGYGGDSREWTHQTFGGVVYENQGDGNYTIQTYYQGNLIRNVPRRYLQELVPEFQRALQKMAQGFRRAALVSLYDSAKAHPLHYPSYRLALTQLLEFGRIKDAVNLGKRAVHLVPNSSRLHYLLGLALMRSFQFSEAIMAFRVALRLDPYDQQTMNMLTAAEMKARITASNFNESVPELHQLFDEDPGSMSLIKNVKRLQTRLRHDDNELPPIEGDTTGGMKRYSSQNYALTAARLELISYLRESLKTVTMFFCRGTSRTIHQNRLYCSNASGSLLCKRPKYFGKHGYNVPKSLQQVMIGNSSYRVAREVSSASYHKLLIGNFYDPSLKSPDLHASLKRFQDICFNFALIGDLGTAMNPVSRRRSSVIKANMAITEHEAPAQPVGGKMDTQPQFQDNTKEALRRRSTGPLPYEHMIPSSQDDEALYAKFAENLIPPHKREKSGNQLSIGFKPFASESKDSSRIKRRWSLTAPRPPPSTRRKSLDERKTRRVAARRRLSLPAVYDTPGINSILHEVPSAESSQRGMQDSESEPGSDNSTDKHDSKASTEVNKNSVRGVDAFDFFNEFVPSVTKSDGTNGEHSLGGENALVTEHTKTGNESKPSVHLAKNNYRDQQTSDVAEGLAKAGSDYITSKNRETSAVTEAPMVPSTENYTAEIPSAIPSSLKKNTEEPTRDGETISTAPTQPRSSSSFSNQSALQSTVPEEQDEQRQYRAGRTIKQAKSTSNMATPRPPSGARRLPTVEERRPGSGYSAGRTTVNTQSSQAHQDSYSKPSSGQSGQRIRKKTRIVLTDSDVESDAESTEAFHNTRDIKLPEEHGGDVQRKIGKQTTSQKLQYKRSDRYVAAKASLKTILQRTGPTISSRINLMTEGSAMRASMLRYMESGQYYREVSVKKHMLKSPCYDVTGLQVCLAMKVARRYFRTKKAKDNDIVIFDVDDTALTSFAYFAQAQLERVPLASPDWFHLANSPPLYPVLELYQFLRRRKYNIVFLSERPSYSLHHTKEALIRAGYDSFKHLMVRPEEHNRDSNKTAKTVPLSASEFKFESRVSLKNQGYRICATVGDQSSDFAGDYTGFKVKLPNYCYIED